MNHPSHIPTFNSEQAYDALLDAGSLVSRLIQSPCTLEELSKEFPDIPSLGALERQLRRLVRSGIVRKEGTTYQVTSRFFYTYRQGGQLDLLNQVFIPALLNLASDDAEGLLLPLHLNLDPEEQEKIFTSEVTPLLEELSAVSEGGGETDPDRFVFVVGTPDFPSTLEGFDQAIELIRSAARNRADPQERDRSVLTYFQSRLQSSARIHQTLLQFERRFESRKAAPSQATYALLLGSGTKLPSGDVK